eukprot:5598440-Prymnesium_polylepis.1
MCRRQGCSGHSAASGFAMATVALAGAALARSPRGGSRRFLAAMTFHHFSAPMPALVALWCLAAVERTP